MRSARHARHRTGCPIPRPAAPYICRSIRVSTPSSMAFDTASARLLAPTFSKIADTWCPTVFAEMCRVAAIWGFVVESVCEPAEHFELAVSKPEGIAERAPRRTAGDAAEPALPHPRCDHVPEWPRTQAAEDLKCLRKRLVVTLRERECHLIRTPDHPPGLRGGAPLLREHEPYGSATVAGSGVTSTPPMLSQNAARRPPKDARTRLPCDRWVRSARGCARDARTATPPLHEPWRPARAVGGHACARRAPTLHPAADRHRGRPDGCGASLAP